MLKKITVNLMVEDVQKSLLFYCEILHFDFVMGVLPETNEVIVENDFKRKLLYALVKSGSVEIMFQARESLSVEIPQYSDKPIGASASFYIETDDIDKLHENLKSKVKIIKDIHTTWYGMREFYIEDCNGYILGFAKHE